MVTSPRKKKKMVTPEKNWRLQRIWRVSFLMVDWYVSSGFVKLRVIIIHKTTKCVEMGNRIKLTELKNYNKPAFIVNLQYNSST